MVVVVGVNMAGAGGGGQTLSSGLFPRKAPVWCQGLVPPRRWLCEHRDLLHACSAPWIKVGPEVPGDRLVLQNKSK